MIDHQNLGQQAYDLAFSYEQTKSHCVQCTLGAIMEITHSIDRELFKAADGLTAGGALSGQGTCGALCGGILAISRSTGRTYEEFLAGKGGTSWENVAKLNNLFIEKYGSPVCRRVQEKIFGRSFDFSKPEDGELFNQMGGHVDKCPAVCGDVARWTMEIIQEINPK